MNFKDAEIPRGAVDGANKTFALTETPDPAVSLLLVLNGQVLTPSEDFVLSRNSATLGRAPSPGDSLRAWYRF